MRPTNRLQRNQKTLELVRNLRPWQGGLAPYEVVTPFIDNETLNDAGIVLDWPYPQLFRGRDVTLLADATTIYLVDETNELPFRLIPIDLNDQTITRGGAWQFVDMGAAWILSNGACLVYQRADQFDVVVADISIASLCEHNGRLYVGGFNFAVNGDEDWQDTVDSWIENAPATFDTTLIVPSNMVWWSNVGTLALFWWLIDLTTSVAGDLGTHTAASPLIRELMWRRDWGFAPALGDGPVIALRSLGQSVIAFGSNASTRLTPQGVDCAVTPFGVGLWERGAIAGNRDRLLWVSSAKTLWGASAGGSVERLDYGEYAALLNSGPIIGASDPEEGTLYISDGVTSLFQTESGLAFAPEGPTSLYRVDGVLTGFTLTLSNADQRLEVVSGTTDFGTLGLKTVWQIEVNGNLPEDTVVAVDYRDDTSETWRRSVRRALNADGVCDNINVTAREFRIVVEAPQWYDASIDSIEVQWIQQDKRFASKTALRASRVVEA